MVQESAAGQMPTQGDRLFHTRIAEASDNSVLLRVVTGLFDERHNPLFVQLGSHFENARSWGRRSTSTRPWSTPLPTRILRPREAMLRHLANSHERFMASWPGEGDGRPGRPPRRRPASERPPDMTLSCRIHAARDLRLEELALPELGRTMCR